MPSPSPRERACAGSRRLTRSNTFSDARLGCALGSLCMLTSCLSVARAGRPKLAGSEPSRATALQDCWAFRLHCTAPASYDCPPHLHAPPRLARDSHVPRKDGTDGTAIAILLMAHGAADVLPSDSCQPVRAGAGIGTAGKLTVLPASAGLCGDIPPSNSRGTQVTEGWRCHAGGGGRGGRSTRRERRRTDCLGPEALKPWLGVLAAGLWALGFRVMGAFWKAADGLCCRALEIHD